MDDGGSTMEATPVAGPFSQPVNAALTESFGSLDGISVSRDESAAASMNAKAYTIGSSISLGSGIYDDVSDPFSMEVISHEVAHALAGGGSGETLVDDGRHGADPGEAAAYSASNAFRDFIAGGASGKAPKLAAAHGGRAMVHRFEAGEHADAVDGALQTLRDANAKEPGKYSIDGKTAAAMDRSVTLENGVIVSPGQITAMMGDFYGAYKKDDKGNETFDPMASFEAMNHADPKEMKQIIAKIEEERARVKELKERGGTEELQHADNSDLERITNDRKMTTDENGVTTGYSYLDLAQKNTNHFNAKDESGTDNNMGAYGALHAEAMKVAQEAADETDPAKKHALEDRALAMEASSQHFMTDRFAGGHQFDKQEMLDANGGGLKGNGSVKVVHDQMNDEGADVENASGDKWNAKGDGHWADGNPADGSRGQADSREIVAETVMNSYDQVSQIMAGRQTYDPALDDPTAVAKQTAPAWSDATNAQAQADGKAVGNGQRVEKAVDDPGAIAAGVETWAKRRAEEGAQRQKELDMLPEPQQGPL